MMHQPHDIRTCAGDVAPRTVGHVGSRRAITEPESRTGIDLAHEVGNRTPHARILTPYLAGRVLRQLQRNTRQSILHPRQRQHTTAQDHPGRVASGHVLSSENSRADDALPVGDSASPRMPATVRSRCRGRETIARE
jgi:hypothetical protein